jgi:hypothetical protein
MSHVQVYDALNLHVTMHGHVPDHERRQVNKVFRGAIKLGRQPVTTAGHLRSFRS